MRFEKLLQHWLLWCPWLLSTQTQRPSACASTLNQVRGSEETAASVLLRSFRRHGAREEPLPSGIHTGGAVLWGQGGQGGQELLSQVGHRSSLQSSYSPFWGVENFTCERNQGEPRNEDPRQRVPGAPAEEKEAPARWNRRAAQLPQAAFFTVAHRLLC